MQWFLAKTFILFTAIKKPSFIATYICSYTGSCYIMYKKIICYVHTFIINIHTPDRVDLKLSVEGDEVRCSILPPAAAIMWYCWLLLTILDIDGDLPKQELVESVGETAGIKYKKI